MYAPLQEETHMFTVQTSKDFLQSWCEGLNVQLFNQVLDFCGTYHYSKNYILHHQAVKPF